MNQNNDLFWAMIIGLSMTCGLIIFLSRPAQVTKDELNYKTFPSQRELDSIEFAPVFDPNAYIIDGDTLATENQ